MPTLVQHRRPPTAAPPKSGDFAKLIGARLRTLRKAQKVTLVELSTRSGVDSATISRIETGQMTGTLECHGRLATALGVKITDLYSGIEEARTKDALTLQSSSQHSDMYVRQTGKSSMAMHTSDILKKKLMPVLITIEPGGSTHQEEAKVGTERFLHVLEGHVEIRVGEQTYQLKRGGSVYLDASLLHALRNLGKKTAKCLSVTTPPTL